MAPPVWADVQVVQPTDPILQHHNKYSIHFWYCPTQEEWMQIMEYTLHRPEYLILAFQDTPHYFVVCIHHLQVHMLLALNSTRYCDLTFPNIVMII